MSIFKESLPNYIKDQLTIREAVVRMGNTADTKGRINGIGHADVLGATPYYKGGEKTIQKGAFYTNALNKSCTIRMASLVDLQSEDILAKEGINARIEKDFGGPGMALTYILEGGTIIKGVKDNKMVETVDTEGNPTGDRVRKLSINEKPVMRRGFPTQKWNLGGTYGDPIIRADASPQTGDEPDGYGIVPMPGITGVDIKTKSAYGSLREAKISFECHNLRQLEILELLYMRPGYPVMLEWGWSQYINNDGNIESAPQFISEKKEFWNASEVSQEWCSANIIEQRQKTGGNYDGLLGFCKNFSYTARPDGGFKCSTELMAAGEVMNSLKGVMVTAKTPEGDKFDMPKIQVELNKFVDGFIGIAGGTNKNVGTGSMDFYENTATNEKFITKLASSIQPISGYSKDGAKNAMGEGGDLSSLQKAFNFKQSEAIETSTGHVWHNGVVKLGDEGSAYVEEMLIEDGWTGQKGYGFENKFLGGGDYGDKSVADYEADRNGHIQTWKDRNTAGSTSADTVQNWQQSRMVFWNNAVEVQRKSFEKTLSEEALKDINNSSLLQPGIHLIGPTTDKTGKKALQGKMGYIRLDAFCKLLNKWIIPINTKPSQTGRILSFQTNHFSTHNDFFDTYKFNNYNSKFYALFQEVVDLDISVDPFICLFPQQIVDMEESDSDSNIEFYRPVLDASGYSNNSEASPEEFFGTKWPLTDDQITNEIKKKAKKSVGFIYLNLDMLQKQCKKLQNETKNEHFSLGQFMFNVLEEVNKATGGNHKFAMVNNHEFPNVINIVDINGESAHKTYEDVHEVRVQSNDSVVRKFSFNTEIPSAMTATIAVAAQNPNDANALDEVTFAALNRGIRNRLYRPAGANTPKYSKVEKEKKRAKLDAELLELGNKLGSLKFYNRTIKHRAQQKDDENKDDRISSYRSTLIRVQSLTDIISQKDPDGIPKFKPPSSTPIPIKLDLTFDGIGGLVIGQLFRVQNSRLPKHYRGKNVIFLIKSEKQKIGKNGDWITQISGQMQLFEEPPTLSPYGDDMKRFIKKALRAEEKEKEKADAIANAKGPEQTEDQKAKNEVALTKVKKMRKNRRHIIAWVAKQLRGMLVSWEATMSGDEFLITCNSGGNKQVCFHRAHWFWRTLAVHSGLTWDEVEEIWSWGCTLNPGNSNINFCMIKSDSSKNWGQSHNDLMGDLDKCDCTDNGVRKSIVAEFERRDNTKFKTEQGVINAGVRTHNNGWPGTVSREMAGHWKHEVPDYGMYDPEMIQTILDEEHPSPLCGLEGYYHGDIKGIGNINSATSSNPKNYCYVDAGWRDD